MKLDEEALFFWLKTNQIEISYFRRSGQSFTVNTNKSLPFCFWDICAINKRRPQVELFWGVYAAFHVHVVGDLLDCTKQGLGIS